MAYGEAFLSRVYGALTSNPAKWARTMLIICYDEHGGFFDHVAPPAIQTVAPAGNQWEDPSPMPTLGVRVPGIIVSPLVARGSVYSDLLDHTSILQLLVDRFGTPADLASFGVAAERRDAGVRSLANVLNLSAPRTDIPPAPLPPPQPAPRATPPQVTHMGRMFQGVMNRRPGAGTPLNAPA